MKLYDLLDMELLEEALLHKYVRTSLHATQPLAILNYTEHTQFTGWWNGVTLRTRGLIYNHETMDVLARPWEKFFNYGENWQTDLLSLDEPVQVTDKMDGSLGIMYPYPIRNFTIPLIATRGSFRSEQADKANAIFWTTYGTEWDPVDGFTYLFEIVYPKNRIVVDYEGMSDLVLLGAVDIETGEVFGPEFDADWPGPRTETLPATTIREALSLPLRPGKEGIVVRALSDNTMLKIKQPDYVELHRIVTNLNPRTIWKRCYDADVSLAPEFSRKEAVLEGLPDELYEDVWSQAWVFFGQFSRLRATVDEAWRNHPRLFWDVRPSRREFARWQEGQGFDKWLRTALWLVYDGNNDNLTHFLWKQIKPRGDSK